MYCSVAADVTCPVCTEFLPVIFVEQTNAGGVSAHLKAASFTCSESETPASGTLPRSRRTRGIAPRAAAAVAMLYPYWRPCVYPEALPPYRARVQRTRALNHAVHMLIFNR